ncbi:MAG: branched-chain amino acid ABC transporter permease [Anaerolineae bacterium]|nr:branched-chain amino acid ABC transporter permease [Anaerolineae bacterium]MDK1080586.1 branched-chain amino acid ABC transporter permease [Anaerolineae bacterium]
MIAPADSNNTLAIQLLGIMEPIPQNLRQSSAGKISSWIRKNFITSLGIFIVVLLIWRIVSVAQQDSYPIQYWAFQLINGLTLGGVYALIALGYTLVYGILFMINFAHGEVMMMGGFAGFFTLQLLTYLGWTNDTPFSSAISVVVMMLAGMTVSVLTGVILERIAYRPLRAAPRLVPLISAIGASFFLQYTALLMFGAIPHNYHKPSIFVGVWRIGETGIIISYTGAFIFVTSIIMMIGLYIIVQRTKLGRSMRAVAEDKQIATLMGIDVDKVIVFTFILGSALAGAGGVMLGLHNTVIRFNSGFIPGLKAFTAAVLGGIGNIPGAMVGSLLLGIMEALGPSALGLPTEYKDVIAFSILVLVLIFRPTGLLGEVLSNKKA